MEFYVMIFKLIISLLVVLGMIFLIYRTSAVKVLQLQKGKYIKIIERTQISKETSILVVKIGESGYVLTISPNKTEKLQELSKEEIIKIQNSKRIQIEETNKMYRALYKKIKLKVLKEDKNDK